MVNGYTVKKPVERPVWKNHKIVGHVTISRVDADFLNKIQPNGFYIGYTEEEHRILNYGTEEELKSVGLTW